MAWDTGIQTRIKSENINEQIANLKGFLEPKDAEYWLYKFFLNNPGIATYLLMGVELLPFQRLLIKGMMQNDYTLAVLSRSGGKTWLTGVFVGLYALMHPGVHIGIISATFRQSKEVMKKLITISKSPKAKLFAECMKCSFAPDEWNMEIGASKITALPLGDGSRLRGFRFQMMVIDELLLMPQVVVDEVITPFLAGVRNPVERKRVKELEDRLIAKGMMKEEDRKQWPPNKMIGLSSASYQFEYLYKLYKSYQDSIFGTEDIKKLELEDDDKLLSKDARKFIFHVSYHALPKELFDEKVVKKSMLEMSASQFDREYGAIFTSDSSGYFKISKLKECRYPLGEGVHVEAIGDKNSKYVLSIDPSSGGSEDSDDFAMQLFKLEEGSSNCTLVHSYAMAGLDPRDHAEYFAYLISNFNIVLIIFDNGAGGGARSTLSLWNEHPAIKNTGGDFKIIDVPFNDQTKYNDDLQEFRNQYSLSDRRICYFRNFDLNWQRWANEHLQGCVDHKRIRFASEPVQSQYSDGVPQSVPIDKLKFMTEDDKTEKSKGPARFVDFLDNLSNLVDRTIEQCALIEVSTTDTGSQRFTLPSNLRKQRGVNKARRDSYSALFMGNWGCKIYNDSMNFNPPPKEIGFVPVMF